MKCPECKKHKAVDGGLCYQCLPFNMYTVSPVVPNEDLRRFMIARKGELENLNFAQFTFPNEDSIQEWLDRYDPKAVIEGIAVGETAMIPCTDHHGYKAVIFYRMKKTEWVSDGQHKWWRA